MPISVFVILSLFICLFYFIGFLTFIIDNEENKCDMTYMFEYPQFVKIQMAEEDYFRRYGLYAYSEGKLTERARAMKFDGVPVLFVPGNAGSYKQVRSLASVALRKALHSRSPYHFDFFTLDLNGELSGLNGGVLDEQTKFLNHSLTRILELYNRTKSGVPNSVIIIGHSMGGVIGYNVMKSSQQVDLLVTLASPHRHPILSLDSYMAGYYKKMKAESALISSNFTNKTIITVAAGTHDHLVNSWLTNSTSGSLNVVTTAVPTVWLSMDHACIMWCKQLILTIVRALFDSVDLKTMQLSADDNYRLAAFRHHLLKNSGTNIRWSERYKVITRLDDRGEWREDLRRRYTVSLPRGTAQNQWHMVRLLNDPKHQVLYVQAVNLALTDWIFVCNTDSIRGQSRYCENGIHLSHLSKIAPTAKFKRRTHYVDLFKLKKRYPKTSHVVVRVPPTQDPVFVNFDVHNPKDRIINVQLPGLTSLSRTTVISRTERDALWYELHLSGLQHVIQTYLLYVHPVDCNGDTHHATVTFNVPWARHDSYIYITESLRKPLELRLHSSRPQYLSNLTAKVLLSLDPTCQYTISVRNSFVGMLGQFARFYSPMLIANIAAVVLMTLRAQLISLDKNGYCTMFQSSLCSSAKPYYLITFAKLVSVSRISVGMLTSDTQILASENIEFLLLPLLLYLIAVGLTYMMSIGLWVAVIMNESTVHKLYGKFFSRFANRAFGRLFSFSEWVVNAIHKVPFIVAAVLTFLALSTCGSLALCLGLAYYFLKLTQLCQDCLEGLGYKIAKNFVFGILKKVFSRFKKPKPSENDSHESENTNEKNEKSEKTLQGSTEKTTLTECQIPGTSKSEKTEADNETAQCGDKKIEAEETQGNNRKLESKELADHGDEQQNTDKMQENTNNKKVKGENEDESKSVDLKHSDEQIQKDNEINNLRLREMNSDASQNNVEGTICVTAENKEKATEETNSNKDASSLFGDSTEHSEIHFHFTIFLLWFLVAALNIPSVLTWAHNFQYSNILRPDPSAVYGILLSLFAMLLWQFELPRPHKQHYNYLAMFVYCMALLCLIYAPINQYRLSYILTTTIIVIIVHQFVASNIPDDEFEGDSSNEPDPIALINDIKTKLE